MRKHYVLIAVFLLLGSGLIWGQENSFAVLYTNSTEGITFKPLRKKKVPVIAGMDLPPRGSLNLNAGTWMNVLYNGQKKRLEGPRDYDLYELALEINKKKKSTFLGRFWSFLSNAVREADDTDKLEKYHERYLTKTRAGISGFGDRNYGIQMPRYFSEIFASNEVQFHWESVETKPSYTFQIKNRETGEQVFLAKTTANQITIQLDELSLDTAGIYRWQVSATRPDSTVITSPVAYFSYHPKELIEVINSVQKEEDYLAMEESERALFLQYKLEEAGFLYTAYQRYQQLIELSPENRLSQKLFATFLTRMNALEEAKQIIDK